MVLVAVEHAPRPAATVLVLRDSSAGPEVFMVRRHEGAAFSGAHVFPGGRVDAADRGAADPSWSDGVDAAQRQLADLDAAEAVGYHVAAARELFEEAGVLLARDATGQFVSLADQATHDRFKRYRRTVHSGGAALRQILEREGLRLALDALIAYAHWVTPPLDARRFDTRFFVTRVPPDQTPAHDETETTHGAWITPAAAIAAARQREIVLPPPTWTTLRELERLTSVDEALGWARTRQIARWEPVFQERDGQRMLIMPDDTRFLWSTDRWLLEDQSATEADR
jgi:8-oxo-dGTP pyrophosphatase MutT (NUDIX family)